MKAISHTFAQSKVFSDMGSFSTIHWIIVAVVVLLLFGPGRIAFSMGDFGKGIRAFRKGLADDDTGEIENTGECSPVARDADTSRPAD